jgi:4-hydroxyphenylpyruvate dioxygenase-like putative hemolysin
VPIEGIDFLEFAVDEDEASSLADLFAIALRVANAEAALARAAALHFDTLRQRVAVGEYFQLSTRAFSTRFFFEVVQRSG